jgi:membrane protease YdiL (CAAX protease family)
VRKKILTCFFIFASLVSAFSQGIIDYAGLAAIAGFYSINFIYQRVNQVVLRQILLFFLVMMLVGFLQHRIPGFYNMLVASKLKLSTFSAPFTLYLNFDKTLAALILFLNSGLYEDEKPLNRYAIIQTALCLILSTLTLLLTSYVLGYIVYDMKLPSIWFIWSINNLFFVCFAEEVIFRGMVQKNLKFLVEKIKVPYLHILLSSFFFGLAHYLVGFSYVMLAGLAGCFYGMTYEKTNRIFCAMLVHFGLNLIHFLFFTYPMVAR